MAELNERLERARPIRVAFVGSSESDELPGGFERVSPEAEADVYHVHHERLASVQDLRKRHANAAVVVDLTATSLSQLDRGTLGLVHEADVIAVTSARDAATIELRDRRLGGRTAVMPATIDLGRFAPDAALAASRRVHYSRFKRYHRLAHPTVLFAGDYLPGGGLGLAIDAVFRLRETLEHIRLTTIPLGRVDRRYLDECERKALLLGHRGVIEWTPPTEDDLPFWFGTASVVLVAGPDAARPALLAGAAARPVIALDDDATQSRHAKQAITGDPEALADTIRELLGPTGIAAGEESRRELEALEETRGARLAQLWSSAAFGAGGLTSATLRAVRDVSTSDPSSSTVIHPR
jgi:glycosyltransferase involved in cell wall biosynthesis